MLTDLCIKVPEQGFLHCKLEQNNVFWSPTLNVEYSMF